MCAYLSVNIDCPLINFHRNTYHFKWAPIMKGFFFSLSFSLSMCSLHEPMAFVIVSITRWLCFGGHKTILMCRFNKIHSVFFFILFLLLVRFVVFFNPLARCLFVYDFVFFSFSLLCFAIFFTSNLYRIFLYFTISFFCLIF